MFLGWPQYLEHNHVHFFYQWNPWFWQALLTQTQLEFSLGKLLDLPTIVKFFLWDSNYLPNLCIYRYRHIYTCIYYIMYIIWLVVSIDACFHISLFKSIGILNPNYQNCKLESKKKPSTSQLCFLFFSSSKHSARHIAGGSSQTFRDHGGSCFRKVHHQKTTGQASENIYRTTWFHVFTVAGKFLVSCIYVYLICIWQRNI